jgi:outer membrane protein assembly factor BamB
MNFVAKAARLAALGLLTFSLGACSSLNPFNWFGQSNAPKPAALVQIIKPQPTRVLWQAKVGKSPSGGFEPALVQGSVYAASQDGTVVRLDAHTGAETWRVKVGNSLSAGVGADDQLIVVGSTEGEVIALDPNGRVMWRARVSSEVLSPPAVAGDIVVVRSADSRLFALDAKDGKRVWIYQRAAPSLTVRSAAGVVIKSGFAFAGFPGGKLVAVALNNGGLRWEGTVALPKGTTELERVADVIGMPFLGERDACAVAYQGRVACFDMGSGNQIWAREMSSSTGLSVDGNAVFVSENSGAVSALDRATGTSLWRQDKLANRELSAPLPVGDNVAVGDLQGYVHWLSREDGSFIARQATDGSAILAAPIAIADGLLVQTSNGGLYALAVGTP